MAFTPDDKINLHWPHGIPVYLVTLALALALPVAADSGTWSGEVFLTGPNVYDQDGISIVPTNTEFEAVFLGGYAPSDSGLKEELEDDEDDRARYEFHWTFTPHGQLVAPNNKKQGEGVGLLGRASNLESLELAVNTEMKTVQDSVFGKFTQASSEAGGKIVSVEVRVVGEAVQGEIKETFE